MKEGSSSSFFICLYLKFSIRMFLRSWLFSSRLDIAEKSWTVKSMLSEKIFLTWLLKQGKFLNAYSKNLLLFFRYSTVSLKRKFSLQQKKQNSSITEGCRGEF